MSGNLKEKKVKYENGATRSEQIARYELVPPQGGLKTAIRFGVGAIKHGDENWKTGGIDFIRATFGHMKHHIDKLLLNMDSKDDHLGAIGWAQATLSWFEVNKPTEYRKAIISITASKTK